MNNSLASGLRRALAALSGDPGALLMAWPFAFLALLVATFVPMKLIVLGGCAFGARHLARLPRNPEHARRGRMLTSIVFAAFGVLMIWPVLAATPGTAM